MLDRLLHLIHRPKGNDAVFCVRWQTLDSSVVNLRRDSQNTDRFAQECSLLCLGFSERYPQARAANRDWNPWKARAGAEIEERTEFFGQILGDESAFDEVAAKDFFRCPDGREIQAGIPAQQKVHKIEELLTGSRRRASDSCCEKLVFDLPEIYAHAAIRLYGETDV